MNPVRVPVVGEYLQTVVGFYHVTRVGSTRGRCTPAHPSPRTPIQYYRFRTNNQGKIRIFFGAQALYVQQILSAFEYDLLAAIPG